MKKFKVLTVFTGTQNLFKHAHNRPLLTLGAQKSIIRSVDQFSDRLLEPFMNCSFFSVHGMGIEGYHPCAGGGVDAAGYG